MDTMHLSLFDTRTRTAVTDSARRSSSTDSKRALFTLVLVYLHFSSFKKYFLYQCLDHDAAVTTVLQFSDTRLLLLLLLYSVLYMVSVE